MGTIWELDESKRILMNYWWEQEEFDGNFLGTWQEFNPSPLQKIRNIPWRHGATQLALLTSFILRFFLGTSYWDRSFPWKEIFKNKLRRAERERKLDGPAKKVGSLCVHVHILRACRPFWQRISRIRQNPGSLQSCARPIWKVRKNMQDR